jgi:hypothetical protein
MDEMEFTEAESNLNDLQWEYRPTSGWDDDDVDEFDAEGDENDSEV